MREPSIKPKTSIITKKFGFTLLLFTLSVQLPIVLGTEKWLAISLISWRSGHLMKRPATFFIASQVFKKMKCASPILAILHYLNLGLEICNWIKPFIIPKRSPTPRNDSWLPKIHRVSNNFTLAKTFGGFAPFKVFSVRFTSSWG